jgi:hypothetical protein
MAVVSAVGLAAGAGRAMGATTRRAAGSTGSEWKEAKVTPPGMVGAAPEQVASVSAVELAKPSASAQSAAAASGPAPWDLMRPLALGSLVAQGWRVSELSEIKDGACVLTLSNERGRSHRVHLCRNDGRPQGIVYSDRFDLVVMNGGQGDLPTDEGLAQAVAEVAHVLAANEASRRQEPVVKALMPHAERVRRFAALEGARLR